MKFSITMRIIGRLCFVLIWIPFITFFIGMIGMPDGDYSWSEMPVLSRYSIVAVGAFAAASFVLQVGSTLVNQAVHQSILSNGHSAEATVLDVWDTGTTVNNDPVVRMRLEVRPSDYPTFESETEQMVSRLELPILQPGSVIQVKYGKQNQVALVGITAQAPEQPSE